MFQAGPEHAPFIPWSIIICLILSDFVLVCLALACPAVSTVSFPMVDLPRASPQWYRYMYRTTVDSILGPQGNVPILLLTSTARIGAATL
jgi:hypothetical protein